jgi:Glycosyl hydrolases family 28
LLQGDRKLVHNWTDQSCAKPTECRPRLLGVRHSSNCRVGNLLLHNAVYWTSMIELSSGIAFRNVTIEGDWMIPNNDGIDVSSSMGVSISGVRVSTADDGICIKALTAGRPTRDVAVSDCVIRSRSSALKVGSESLADIEDVAFSNIRVCHHAGSARCHHRVQMMHADMPMRHVNIPQPAPGVPTHADLPAQRLQFRSACLQILPSHRAIGVQLRDGGTGRNISFTDVLLTALRDVRSWWGAGEAVAITVLPRVARQARRSALDGVTIQRIHASSESGVVIAGESPRGRKRRRRISNIAFSDVHMRMRRLSRRSGATRDLRPDLGTLHDNVAVPVVYARQVDHLHMQVSLTYRPCSMWPNGWTSIHAVHAPC